jgi:hypothetical protein
MMELGFAMSRFSATAPTAGGYHKPQHHFSREAKGGLIADPLDESWQTVGIWRSPIYSAEYPNHCPC